MNLSSKLGPRLKVVALIDPAVERAASVLQHKCETFVKSAYENTRIFRSLDDYVKGMDAKDAPRAFVIGSPPMFRGTTQSGRNIEMQILKHFPDVALFVEKPIATGPSAEIQEAFKVAKFIEDKGTICSVGCAPFLRFLNNVRSILMTAIAFERRYMLRYLKAVQMMKKILDDNNLTVMSTIARYACAYEAIAKRDWWTKSIRSVCAFRHYFNSPLSPCVTHLVPVQS